MTIRKFLAMAAVSSSLTAPPASAATLTSLFGDIDGFGGQVTPGVSGLNTGANFDNSTAADPSFTDVWLFEQFGGIGGSPLSFGFSYDLTGATIIGASLEIMQSGMSDGRGPWAVSVGGTSVGLIENGLGTTSTLLSFTIDPSLIGATGTSGMLTYNDSQPEAYAIDYLSLVIDYEASTMTPIPLPAGGALWLTALGGFAVARRRIART